MGRVFLQHLGGTRIYSCKKCKAPLTCVSHIVSTDFVAPSGPAILFEKVVNVRNGPARERELLTGRHSVRDIICKKCDVKLGWMYEFAYVKEETYKEGKSVLEVAKIKESIAFKKKTEHPGDTESESEFDESSDDSCSSDDDADSASDDNDC